MKLLNRFLRLELFSHLLLACFYLHGIDLPALQAQQPAPPKLPHIIIILADDMGRADYSAYGTADLRTPNFDRLFHEGLTWNNFYANSPVCSPTRASLLTGCYPDRVGVPGVIRDIADDNWGSLDPKATLLPQLLKPLGYHSTIIGKWHLGYDTPNTPLDRGFDFFHGFLGDMMDDYWTHRRHDHNFMRRNREEIDPQGHATDLFTDWACSYLKERSTQHQPFFLYLAYNAPHDPVQPPPEWLTRVQQRNPELPEKRAHLVALLEHLDDGVGKVLRTLDELQLSEQTLVIFLSDNGGPLNTSANNGPWRSGKGHVYEGGLRVPCAMRWPGRLTPGSQTDAVGVSMDLLPTLLEIIGATPPARLDGTSLLPVIKDPAHQLPARDLYFCRREGGNAYGGKTIEAIRRGDWKLLQDSPFAPLELYHLGQDPAETTDLAPREKQKFNELSRALRAQIQSGGATPWQAAPEK